MQKTCRNQFTARFKHVLRSGIAPIRADTQTKMQRRIIPRLGASFTPSSQFFVSPSAQSRISPFGASLLRYPSAFSLSPLCSRNYKTQIGDVKKGWVIDHLGMLHSLCKAFCTFPLKLISYMLQLQCSGRLWEVVDISQSRKTAMRRAYIMVYYPPPLMIRRYGC